MNKKIVGKKYDFSDVLIEPSHSMINSRKDINLKIKLSWFLEPIIPIAASNIDGVGTFSMAKTLSKLGLLTFLRKGYSFKEIYENYTSLNTFYPYTIPTIGMISFEELEKLYQISDLFHGIICVDVANAYIDKYIEFIKTIKTNSDLTIIAGNVCTVTGALDLVRVGADIIKVGIGSGSLCTTRLKTGVGCPQLSAIMDIRQALDDYAYDEFQKNEKTEQMRKIGLISDGGITCPGDVAKAFVAGADIVMIGGLFAGYKESEYLFEEATVYGMASRTAMMLYKQDAEYKTSEGRTLNIKVKKQSVSTVVKDILGGLRSACTYTGCKNSQELYEYAYFIEVNNQYNRMFEK